MHRIRPCCVVCCCVTDGRSSPVGARRHMERTSVPMQVMQGAAQVAGYRLLAFYP